MSGTAMSMMRTGIINPSPSIWMRRTPLGADPPSGEHQEVQWYVVIEILNASAMIDIDRMGEQLEVLHTQRGHLIGITSKGMW